MPEIHFPYGGSTATRSLNCSAWKRLSDGKVRTKVSMAASTGTVGHKIFEKMTDSDTFDPDTMLGEVHTVDRNKVTIDQKLITKIEDAIEAQDDFFDEHDIQVVYCETLFEHSDLIGGSADTVGWNKEKNIFCVGDLKTGDGHMVFAEDNDQLMFYAWLAVTHYAKDFTFDGNTRIILYIVQPSDRRDEILDTWEVNLGDIIAFGKAFELAVRVSEGGLGDPTCGDWCLYCPAAATCPAKNAIVAESGRLDMESDDMAVLERGMAMVEDVEQWCRDIRAMAHEQLEMGVEVEGWKLVPKRATRVWNDHDDAASTFKSARSLKIEDYMDMKLKSPPQMEKVCKAKGIDFKKYEDMFSSISSGTTMAKASDKRAAALPLDGMASAIAQLT